MYYNYPLGLVFWFTLSRFPVLFTYGLVILIYHVEEVSHYCLSATLIFLDP